MRFNSNHRRVVMRLFDNSKKYFKDSVPVKGAVTIHQMLYPYKNPLRNHLVVSKKRTGNQSIKSAFGSFLLFFLFCAENPS
jgi:hypothetical protein